MAGEDRLRVRIALESARIMAEEGIEDYGLAKKKAAVRLGLPSHRDLPSREEIDAALAEHHRLFGFASQPSHLHQLRQLALEAMQFLAAFSPVLVGGAWSGGAGRFSPVRLCLYPPSPEDVMRRLLDARIPFEEKSHAVTSDEEPQAIQPALHFYVDGTRIELLLLPARWKGQTLRHKGETLKGGGIRELQKLMGQIAAKG